MYGKSENGNRNILQYRDAVATFVPKRLIRGSRFGKAFPPDEQEQVFQEEERFEAKNEEENSSSKAKHGYYENNSQKYKNQPTQSAYDTQEFEAERDHYRSGRKLDPAPTGGRRGQVQKLIKYAATYGDVIDGKISGDPFLTSPYVKETKVRFDMNQGTSALEEAARKRLEPTNCNVNVNYISIPNIPIMLLHWHECKFISRDTIALQVVLFPGQGSQFVGMCGDPSKMPKATKAMFEIANTILGYDLLDLCLNGPIEKLNQTVHCQPAVVLCSLAAVEKLREENAEELNRTVATAGFSVGEISALVFSGILSFEDAIRLVKVRAEAMQLASEMHPSGMSTVLLSASSKLSKIILIVMKVSLKM